MASQFKLPVFVLPAYSRLLSVLNNTGIQEKQNNLYQFLKQFLDFVISFINQATSAFAILEAQAGATTNATYLTSTDQSAVLPFSRNLVAGAGIAFDDSVANVRTISTTATGSQYMPVFAGGLAVTMGDRYLVAIPWTAPSS
jgi:LytS/YehU family sensor histidine kinase